MLQSVDVNTKKSNIGWNGRVSLIRKSCWESRWWWFQNMELLPIQLWHGWCSGVVQKDILRGELVLSKVSWEALREALAVLERPSTVEEITDATWKVAMLYFSVLWWSSWATNNLEGDLYCNKWKSSLSSISHWANSPMMRNGSSISNTEWHQALEKKCRLRKLDSWGKTDIGGFQVLELYSQRIGCSVERQQNFPAMVRKVKVDPI